MESKNRLATIFFAYQKFASLIDYEAYGLTKNQHRVLFCLYTLEEASIKNLLLVLNISKQACHVLVKDLVERELVYEVPSKVDKRIKLLKLTTKGHELNQQMNQEQSQIIDAIFEAQDDDFERAMAQMADDYLDALK
ncbi:MarR family winged helix-turn-helix transcriptional regulator [Holzapfeliella floricola]|uniref:HTH marR-type domain-containing protein n=1 Tax=Holzapfeliella floricola DSM 23037 = JCM 16512 TaxID=1423744 RepID=A0A0R2DV02_9LACO|nr:MarR family transcriptional regulator [Holzapfeliella floricola]KRN04807.1 hypothetical protein FC86_GL001164 [Holzapfeliella floricola DSM 23037 = JCM 16512]